MRIKKEHQKLPKITKEKIIISLNQKSARDTDFLRLFEKPRDIYLFSILLNHEITNRIEHEEMLIEMNELQKKYKHIRGESRYDLMEYLNYMNMGIFSNYKLDKEKQILTYNINPNFYDSTENTFFLNIALLKGLKINSQKIAVYILSMGKYANYLHTSHVSRILRIEEKSNKLKHKSIKMALETLEKYGFLSITGYDRTKKVFKIKVEDIKIKELFQSFDFDPFN